MKSFLSGILAAMFVLAVVSCEKAPNKPVLSIHGGDAVIDPDKYVTDFEIQVYPLQTKKEVTKMYTTLKGSPVPKGLEIAGFQAGGIRKSTGHRVCIIVGLKPSTVDDDASLTLGHELWHCVAGNYHKEDTP